MRKGLSLRGQLLLLLVLGIAGSAGMLAYVLYQGGSIPWDAWVVAAVVPLVLVIPSMFREPKTQAAALLAVTVLLIPWIGLWIALFGIGLPWIPAGLLAIGLSVAHIRLAFR